MKKGKKYITGAEEWAYEDAKDEAMDRAALWLPVTVPVILGFLLYAPTWVVLLVGGVAAGIKVAEWTWGD